MPSSSGRLHIVNLRTPADRPGAERLREVRERESHHSARWTLGSRRSRVGESRSPANSPRRGILSRVVLTGGRGEVDRQLLCSAPTARSYPESCTGKPPSRCRPGSRAERKCDRSRCLATCGHVSTRLGDGKRTRDHHGAGTASIAFDEVERAVEGDGAPGEGPADEEVDEVSAANTHPVVLRTAQ